MKATILVRDLVKLIAKHGDLDVKMCIEVKSSKGTPTADVKCIDELLPNDCDNNPAAFEIYGEEQ